ncbi:hypothetical protein DACRYDRAFT_19737, partial [Dacryopinax primogenitus]
KSIGLEIERGLRRLSLLREHGNAEDNPVEIEEIYERVLSVERQRLAERSTSKQRNSSIGVRKAGMVFLAVGTLIRVGYPSFNDVRHLSPAGQVLGEVEAPMPNLDMPFLRAASSDSHVLQPMTVEPSREADTERILGRVSAWTCTTLYLTSRLPQIWKNFVRKSVEGLSMSLFVCAFFGNFFYVLSILTSPLAIGQDASAFLMESIPYLLGSGGVLLFDLVIVLQGQMYKNRKPMDFNDAHDSDDEDMRGRSRERRPSARESNGLLESDERFESYDATLTPNQG